MDIAKAFEVAFNRKMEKNLEKIYVVVDIHDTILRACYENEENYDYYPYSSLEVGNTIVKPQLNA